MELGGAEEKTIIKTHYVRKNLFSRKGKIYSAFLV